jgi:hypothetical protein
MFKMSSAFLRRVLAVDAMLAFVMGLSHLLASEALSERFGMPASWLLWAGLIALAAAVIAGWLATRPRPASGVVRLLAAGNFGWVVASLWVVWGAGLSLSSLGVGWVLLQAVAVFVMAELEWGGASSVPTLATT